MMLNQRTKELPLAIKNNSLTEEENPTEGWRIKLHHGLCACMLLGIFLTKLMASMFPRDDMMSLLGTTNATTKKIAPESVPLIILKNGRSGSTWLKDLLKEPNVSSIDFEIITKSKAPKMSTHRKQKLISSSLTDKTGGLAIKGFTACPSLRTGGIQKDFDDVIDNTMTNFPRARILIFSRSNMFRTAIASHSTNHKKPHCRDDKVLQTSFNFENFQCELPHVMMYHKHLLALGQALKVRGYPVFFVMYEDLKRDTAGTMSRILDFIFESCDETTCHNPDRAKQMILAKFQATDGTNTTSTTTSNARGVDSRFNIADRELYRTFFEQMNSTCLMDQLDAIGDPTFDECAYPFEHEITRGCPKKDPSYQCV